MKIEILSYTQIASILVFIVALFILYRILVSQKDAAIELLKEKNKSLSHKLTDALANTPDALAHSLNARVHTLEDELTRLFKDKVNNQDVIELKERELNSLKAKADELGKQIALANELMAEFSCPHCGSPMAERAYQSESVEHNGREVDIDHEYYSYECGYALSDGSEVRPCRGNEPHVQSSIFSKNT